MAQRSKARKEALDQLFQADLRKSEISLGVDGEVRDYAAEILAGVKANNARIDELIRSYIQGWDFDRIPSVDRNILRLGIYEVLWSSDVPTSVAIDEALILAKELSSDDSSKYIHGVLGRIASIKDTISI